MKWPWLVKRASYLISQCRTRHNVHPQQGPQVSPQRVSLGHQVKTVRVTSTHWRDRDSDFLSVLSKNRWCLCRPPRAQQNPRLRL